MTQTNSLTPAMIECFAWIDGRPGKPWRKTFRVGAFAAGHGPSRATLKAMADRGLLTFRGATRWEHGLGNQVCYTITDAARQILAARRVAIAIGALAG